MALVMVLAGSAAALALAFAMITLTLGSIGSSRTSEATVAAEAAADAGIEDFLYRLNRDADYWRYAWTNPATGTRQPLPTGTTNDALTTAGKTVPGGNTEERYRYEVTDPPTGANGGRMTLKVVGTSRRSAHTFKATIGRSGFLDYMYFTDYETMDPARYPLTASSPNLTQAQAVTRCAQYKWRQIQLGISRDGGCQELYFTQFDQVNGPLHTNDTLKTNSSTAGWPRFLGPVSTANPTSPFYQRTGSLPTFSGGIQNRPNIAMPTSNTQMQALATANGCMFTGPTRIWLTSNGKMRVRSPLTKVTRPGCTPSVTVDMNLPPNGVIYVQGVPTAPTDPNYGTQCNTSGYYPNLNTSAPAPPNIRPAGDITQYGCRDGDVFIQGTLKGQLTVAAMNRIIVTNNLVYSDAVAPNYNTIAATSTDVLGLVPNNSVEIYHPVNNSDTNLAGAITNVKLNAALLAIQHSVFVPNHTEGSQLGTLTILGAMAQRFRGPVGQFNTSTGGIISGYGKGYVYDSRLKVIAPPYFLDPVNSGWQVKNFAEVRNGS